jgi:hypothetical protein
MAQLKYIGLVEKTLIDVAPLVTGTIIDVTDEFAKRLLTAFPDQYESVSGQPAKEVSKAPKEQTAKVEDSSKTQSNEEAKTDSSNEQTN